MPHPDPTREAAKRNAWTLGTPEREAQLRRETERLYREGGIAWQEPESTERMLRRKRRHSGIPPRPVFNDRGDSYPSAQEAAEAHGVCYSAVCGACRSGRPLFGVRWRYGEKAVVQEVNSRPAARPGA